jgi:hypothetical protein
MSPEATSKLCSCGGIVVYDAQYFWCLDCATEFSCLRPPSKEALGLWGHLWTIEIPEGPTSTGVCQYCGITKEFVNNVNLVPHMFRDRSWLSRPGPGYQGDA